MTTTEKGKVTVMHTGLKDLMNAELLRALALRTRRGQARRVHEGRIPGGHSYGYQIANHIEGNELKRGLREIDPEQANIIRTIYQLYADGLSTRAIAALLNDHGTPAPRGGQWTASSINGHRKRRNGVLNNELYRGLIIYNRQRFVRDPESGKRVAHTNPEKDWIVGNAPELRIIDDKLWRRVQLRRRGGHDRRTKPGPHAPRPLSGLIKCGVCGATMTIIARGRYGCSRRRGSGTCTNSRRIAAAELELRVAEQLITSTAECGDWLAFAEQITTKSNERKTVLSHHIAKNRRAITQLLKTIDRDTAALNSQLRIAELEYDTAIHEREFKSLNIPAGPVPVDKPHQASLAHLDGRRPHQTPQRRALDPSPTVSPGTRRAETCSHDPDNLMAVRRAPPL